MKKYLKFLIAFVMIIAVTGCGKKERTSLEVLNDAIKNTETVNSGKVDFSVNVKANYQGMSIDTVFDLGVAVQLENDNNFKAVMDLADNPLIGVQKLYLDKNGEKALVYMSNKLIDKIIGFESDYDYWIKEEANFNDIVSDIEDENNDFNLKDIKIDEILTDKDFYLVSKENNVGVYRLVVSKELLMKINKYFDPESSEDFSELKNNLNVDLTIDEKANRITKVSVDLMEVIKGIDLGEEIDITEVLEKCLFEVEITYGNVTVEIPNDVINNAITSEEYTKILANE